MRPITAVSFLWSLSIMAATVLLAAAAQGGDWATGTALQKKLANPVDIFWSGNPLRPALEGLARAQHVGLLIDRRVDPGQKLDVQLSATPLLQALREALENRHLDVSVLGPVVYVGPAEAAARLRTLAALRLEDTERLPAAVARKLLQAQPMSWRDFATPRDLLQKLGQQARLEIAELDRVPHDLWAAADLPPLPLLDRITLIVVQFDLTFEIASDGRQVRLVPLPGKVTLVRSYPGGRNSQATAKSFAARAPQAEIKVVGDKVYVRAVVEDHERLAASHRTLESAPTRPPPPGSRVRIDRLRIQEKA
ncbi:MAG: hypothetical protein ABSG68_26220, partial [Thermoguttaceae bacterium]